MTKLVLAAFAAAFVATPVIAQDSSYTPTTVWDVANLKVEPGQFENYMDYLDGPYKTQMMMEEKMGYVVSYHVFSVNDARQGEPDLILATEYKDYVPVAEQMAIQKKMMAALASDPHKFETASGQRTKMRTEMGSMQLQELKLK